MSVKSFGVFSPGSSLAHKLDPRTKVLFVLIYIVAVFVSQGPVMLVACALVAVASLAASSVGPRQALAMLRPFVWLLLFVAVFDVLFEGSGEVLFRAGPVVVSTGGVVLAVESAVRFSCMLLGTSTLMYTTSPTALTDGIAKLLSPLRRVGVRVDDAALALSLTLRFIPLVSEEFTRVKEAQEARLADFSGGVMRRLRAYGTVFVPLFAGAMRRADTLALAIENRQYGTSEARTCFRAYRLHSTDAIALALVCVLLVAAAASLVL